MSPKVKSMFNQQKQNPCGGCGWCSDCLLVERQAGLSMDEHLEAFGRQLDVKTAENVQRQQDEDGFTEFLRARKIARFPRAYVELLVQCGEISQEAAEQVLRENVDDQ